MDGNITSRKITLLIVEDTHAILRSLKIYLEHRSDFKVFSAVNSEEAIQLMKKHKFNRLLLDLAIEGEGNLAGIELAKACRTINPDPSLGILLWTGHPEYLFRKYIDLGIVNDVIGKPTDYDILCKLISTVTERNITVLRKSVMQVVRTADESGAEKLDGILTKDRTPISWVVYHYPGTNIHTESTISVASSVGCVGHCAFCQSRKRPFRRKLSVQEIIDQILHAFASSYHAFDFFKQRNDYKMMRINFACEGDSVVSNLDNCCTAVQLLNAPDISFIMTTTGHAESLSRFLIKYRDLPIEFYWSLNFSNEKMRAKFMPGTRNQSLRTLKSIFQEIAYATNRIVTVSYIVMAGLNDTKDDIAALKKLFPKPGPFQFKLMALEPNSLLGIKTTEADVNALMEKLMKAGFACRYRKIVGGKIKASCGTTVPLLI